MNDEILTIPEVAHYLKLSKSKVYALAQSGAIPTVKIGKNIRIRKGDLDQWIEAHLAKAVSGYMANAKGKIRL